MEVNKIYETKILRYNNEGLGVGIIDNIVTFINNALIDEIVKVRISKIYKNYATGDLIEIIEKSSNRKTLKCPYFYECGGCNIMHIDYEKQLEFKKEKIASIFKKICGIDIKLKEVNSYNNLGYRNKVVFKVKNDKIGFYKPKTNQIVDIRECIISDKKINDCLLNLRTFIKKYNDNKISEIMVRVCDNNVMLSLDKINEKYKDKFIEEFNYINSIYINDKLVFGMPSLNQRLNNLVFNISPKSFFQVNPKATENLYNRVLEYANKSDISVDLYSGTGTITMLLSKKAKKVVGVEVVKEAVEDAKNNLKLNNIDNVEFICGKVEDKIEKLKNLNVDVLVLDPPRGGSDKKSLKSILEISPEKIIYISCNPVTLARDINLLKDKYELSDISAFDMFPQTYHVECVCLLNRR
ncbi:MAG: 23S rRNA (uracil(1939)-C(5))-methyltransferase RlmD [Bacilli bacterium]|nr:23S rRNA (uracil(1939)-C(5))-methyltransferase RlmD [Bacilli bacterium]